MSHSTPAGYRLVSMAKTHIEAVLAMCEAYYQGEGYAFDKAHLRRAITMLGSDNRLGHIWVTLSPESKPVGYLAVTLGFSLEYGGCDAFLDEMYVETDHRRKGFGRALMTEAIDWCRAHEVRAIHLEVEAVNAGAEAFYRKVGFGGNDRRLLTLRLA